MKVLCDVHLFDKHWAALAEMPSDSPCYYEAATTLGLRC